MGVTRVRGRSGDLLRYLGARALCAQSPSVLVSKTIWNQRNPDPVTREGLIISFSDKRVAGYLQVCAAGIKSTTATHVYTVLYVNTTHVA